MTVRRLLWILPPILIVAALAYTAWLAWTIRADLTGAEKSAQQLRAALGSQDSDARDRAIRDLTDQAASARGSADGAWWGAVTHLPFVGDDADGVQGMSRAIDVVASRAARPLGRAVDRVDDLTANGRIDLDTLSAMQRPVDRAHDALAMADAELARRDSSGYVDALGTRYDELADLVHQLRGTLASADTAIRVLPEMAGADGPREYLLIFQNNAEIRGTGGLPGSWAIVRAERGRLSIGRQGSVSDFPVPEQPVAPLSHAETAVYGEVFGQYFHDAGFTLDFPRAAELWGAHWRDTYPDVPIDGVLAIDPVAMSYLLAGTGPVTVGDVTLTAENADRELLSEPYLRYQDPEQQDRFFAAAARAVFRAVTGELASPMEFVKGLDRAAGERRLLVAPYDPDLAAALHGSAVEGALVGDDGRTPHVDVGLNDLTGSKMSYYLRYDGGVRATSCRDGVQQLAGSVTLRQTIARARAASLPRYISGGGEHGTDPGSQYVMVRVYGPWRGRIDMVRLDGRALRDVHAVELDGRPVVSVDVLLSSRAASRLSWEGATGPGQTGTGETVMTPGVTPGDSSSTFGSAC